MMIMTKPGKFKSQIWKGVCTDCSAEFECLLEDLRERVTYNTKSGMRDGPAYAKINCTECLTKMSLVFHFDRELEAAHKEQEDA